MNNFKNQTRNTYEINTRDKQYLPKSKDIEVGFFINKKNNVNKILFIVDHLFTLVFFFDNVLHLVFFVYSPQDRLVYALGQVRLQDWVCVFVQVLVQAINILTEHISNQSMRELYIHVTLVDYEQILKLDQEHI